MSEISERLKQLRKSKNLTIQLLCETINIPVRTYQNYEYGTREISTEALIKLAQFYGVTTDYLLGITNPDEEPNVINDLVKQYNLDPLEEKILREYIKLPDKARESIMDFLKRTVAAKEDKEDGGD